jgi:uncharacterized protein (DUF2267 family)
MPLTIEGIDELYANGLISADQRGTLRKKFADDQRELYQTKTRFVSAISKEIQDNWAHFVTSLKETGTELGRIPAETKLLAAKYSSTAVAAQKAAAAEAIPKTKYSGFFLAPLAEAAWHGLALLSSPITAQGKLAREDTEKFLINHGANPFVANIAGVTAEIGIPLFLSLGTKGVGLKAVKSAFNAETWSKAFRASPEVNQVLQEIIPETTRTRAAATLQQQVQEALRTTARTDIEQQAQAATREAQAFLAKKAPTGPGLERMLDIEKEQQAVAATAKAAKETAAKTAAAKATVEEQAAAATKEAEQFLEKKTAGPGLEDFVNGRIETYSKAHDALAAAQESVMGPAEAAPIQQAAAAVKPPNADKIKTAQAASYGLTRRSPARLTGAASADMLAGVKSTNDPYELLSVAVDQSIPRDVRNLASDRLNELKAKDVGEVIRSIDDRELLGKISRTGTVHQKFAAMAKGVLAELPKPTAEEADLLARLEKMPHVTLPSGQRVIVGGGAPAPDEYVQQFNNVVKGYKAELDRYQAHGLTRAMAEEQASKLLGEGYGLNDVMSILPQEAKNPAQTLATVKTVLPYAEDTLRLREAARTDDEAFMKILGNVTTVFGANPRYFGIRSTAGQTLGIYRDPTFGQSKFLEQFHKMASWMAGMELNSPEDIMRHKDRILNVLDQFKNPAQLIKHQLSMPEELPKMNWWDAWTGYFAQNLLGPLVISKKMFGDAAATLYRPLIEKPMERALYKGLSRFSENPLGLTISDIPVEGETVASLYGYRRGWMRAWDYLRNKDFLGLAEATGESSLQFKPSLSNFLEERFGKAGAAFGDTVGFIPSAIKHLTNAARLAAFETEASGLLWREGVQMGKTGPELENWVEEGLRSMPPHMMDRALKTAESATFTDAPGAFAQWVNEGLNKFKVMKFDVPFWRVPVNLLRWGYQRSPVLSLTSVQNLRDIGILGGPMREMGGRISEAGIEGLNAISKMMLGNIVGGGLIMGGYAGWITGSGPNDPKLRSEMIQAGAFKPYSIYNPIGRNWISYELLHPFKAPIGTAADIGFLWSQLPWNEGAIKDTEHAMTAFGAATARNFGENPFFQGITSTAKTIDEIMHGTIGGHAAFERATGQFLSGFIPLSSVWRYVAQEVDPGLKEVHGVMDVVESQLPILNKTLYPKRDIFGKPEKLPDSLGPRMFSLIRTREETDDPVAKEHLRLQLGFGDMGDHIMGPQEPADPTKIVTRTGVPLNPDEQDFRNQRLGELYLESAKEIIGAPDYKSMPDAEKIKALRNARGAARNQATGEAIDKFPSLAARVDQHLSGADTSVDVNTPVGQAVLDYQSIREGSPTDQQPLP